MFKVWNPDDGDEENAVFYDPDVFVGHPQWAAEAFARNRDWEFGSGPSEIQTIFVRWSKDSVKEYIVRSKDYKGRVFYYAEEQS